MAPRSRTIARACHVSCRERCATRCRTKLLATLQREVSELSKTNHEDARSIANFTEVSALEATRSEQNPKLRELSLEGMKSSVEGFEETHPKLVQAVNSISQTLSNLGI